MRLPKTVFLLALCSCCAMGVFANGQQETASQQGIYDGPLEKYPEPLTVTAAIEERQIEDSKVPEGISPKTQSWLSLVKDNLNIDLDYIWTVPPDQFKQKLSLSIAAGDIPNLLFVEAAQFKNLYESNLLADISDSYERVASEDLKRALEADGGTALEACTIDGKLMALPQYMDPYQQVQLIWLREDWRKKLDLPEPDSMEDLMEIMRAFAKNDPDGNGKDDTYGLGINKELIFWGFDIRGFLNMFGAYGESWIQDESGNLIYGDIQDEVLDALTVLRELYSDGIIDPEYAVKDYTKVTEDIVAGKIGLVFGEWWYPNWPLNMNKEKQPEAEWKCYELVSATEEAVQYGVKRNWIAYYSVFSKDMANLDAGIKMQNLFYDIDHHGRAYAEAKYGPDATPEGGYVYNWVPQRTFYPLKMKQNYFAIQDILENGKEYEPTPEIFPETWQATEEYLSGEDTSPANWGKYFSRAAKDGGWGLTERVRERGNVVFDEYYGSLTPTQIERGDTLKRLRDETFHKIIMGNAPLSDFSEYVKNWKKLGGDMITEEVNDWYQAK